MLNDVLLGWLPTRPNFHALQWQCLHLRLWQIVLHGRHGMGRHALSQLSGHLSCCSRLACWWTLITTYIQQTTLVRSSVILAWYPRVVSVLPQGHPLLFFARKMRCQKNQARLQRAPTCFQVAKACSYDDVMHEHSSCSGLLCYVTLVTDLTRTAGVTIDPLLIHLRG
jgi:hypothetical protein